MQPYAVPKHLKVRPSTSAVSETEMAVYQLQHKFTENCRVQIIARLVHEASPQQKEGFRTYKCVHAGI